MVVQGNASADSAYLNMKVIFRADASVQIGTGHVMRCLTLAQELTTQGKRCQFICREHEGNLIALIRTKGFVVHVLPPEHQVGICAEPASVASGEELKHAAWLGASQAQDALACNALLAQEPVDWLVVDHYALDARWEEAMAPCFRRLMVIDDLADRRHACSVLLDQTYGRDPKDYEHLVSKGCKLLCGSQYALLRPEFAQLRAYSLQRRAQPSLRELLVTMGGVDKDNATGRVLQALRSCNLPDDCRITVVMGATSPWLDAVRIAAEQLPWTSRMLVAVEDMAQLMAESDLAIGAAGATSWERCCLGLPTLMLILAPNQMLAAKLLEIANVIHILRFDLRLDENLRQIIEGFIDNPIELQYLSQKACHVADGGGCMRVVEKLDSWY